MLYEFVIDGTYYRGDKQSMLLTKTKRKNGMYNNGHYRCGISEHDKSIAKILRSITTSYLSIIDVSTSSYKAEVAIRFHRDTGCLINVDKLPKLKGKIELGSSMVTGKKCLVVTWTNNQFILPILSRRYEN